MFPLFLFFLLCFLSSLSLEDRYKRVNRVKLYYRIADQGEPVVMLYAISCPDNVKRLIISNSMPARGGKWKREMTMIQLDREHRYGVKEKLEELKRSGLRR